MPSGSELLMRPGCVSTSTTAVLRLNAISPTRTSVMFRYVSMARFPARRLSIGRWVDPRAMAWPRAVWYRRRMAVVKPERFFHERFGLSDRALERVLGTALERRADWADLYFEFRVNQTASLEEGVVK